jgi:hypothetical protein
MRLVHCARCRFNFEADEATARCPQCQGPAEPAELAVRPQGESSRTQELHIVPTDDDKE